MDDGWMGLDATANGLQVRFYPDFLVLEQNPRGLLDILVQEGHQILPANGIIDPRYLWRIGPMTCVELVRQLLAIRNPFVFTPKQLYRYIVKHRLNMFQYSRIPTKGGEDVQAEET